MRNSDKALDKSSLEELALRYVSRYATTRHKLIAYLQRKLRERDWKGEASPATAAIADRFVELGYIDDALFAKNRANSLLNRGYGMRRISQALYQAGIGEDDSQPAEMIGEERKWEAAQIYARKKRIGPFASEQQDRDICRKQLQAFLRAGHDFSIASRFVFAKPGDEIDGNV